MRVISWFIFGILLGIYAHTLDAWLGFGALILFYNYALFLLMHKSSKPLSFIYGLTISTELVRDNRFGLALVASILAIALAEIFGQKTRFTSLYLRYIFATLILDLCSLFLLFPANNFSVKLLTLIPWIIITAIISYLLTSMNKEGYEILSGI